MKYSNSFANDNAISEQPLEKKRYKYTQGLLERRKPNVKTRSTQLPGARNYPLRYSCCSTNLPLMNYFILCDTLFRISRFPNLGAD